MRPEHSQWKKGLIVSERDMRGLREMLLRRRRGIFQRFESDWQALGERDIELEEEGQKADLTSLYDHWRGTA